jgi:hypothetical protein
MADLAVGLEIDLDVLRAVELGGIDAGHGVLLRGWVRRGACTRRP